MEDSCDTPDSNENVMARLRRLKIQQNILQKAVAKSWLKYDAYGNEEVHDNYIVNNLSTKTFIDKLKTSYNNIKNLYEDIKISTAQECDSMDIQQIKRDIMDLEHKIKSLKQFIRNELEAFKMEDISGKIKVYENKKPEIKSIKSSVSSKRITLCSPVKVMIESPFKYSEVQRLQDFLKNSPNRYGGWNEYNHNVFLNTWKKFNNCNEDHDLITEDSISLTFRDEVLLKIPGLTVSELNSHIHWYLEYLQLKRCQQAALDKWKENRKKIKKTRQSIHKHLETPVAVKNMAHPSPIRKHRQNNSDNVEIVADGSVSCSSKSDTMLSKGRINVQEVTQGIMRPTKQWINKCEDQKETSSYYCDIERVNKLNIPQWRAHLIGT